MQVRPSCFFPACFVRPVAASQAMTRIMSMKPPALLLLTVCSLVLTGCARNYTLTLNSGSRITTKGKPKLEHGYYVFKDSQGKPGSVPAGRVRELSPSNMTSSRVNSGYSAEPIK